MIIPRHVATILAAVTLTAVAVRADAGNAVRLDGVNSYVDIPDSPDINVGTHAQRTVEAWFRVNDKMNAWNN